MKYLVLVVLATVLVCGGCSNGSSSGIDGGTTDSDTDTDTDVDTDADTDTDSDTDTGTGNPICDELDLDIVPTRLVFLLDISDSMGSENRLNDAKTAIYEILTTWGSSGQIQFGFDYYSNDGSSGVNSSIPIAPAAGTEASIQTMVNGLFADGGTPTYEAMNNYTGAGYAAGFPEAGTESYLLIISGGSPDSGTSTTFGTLSADLVTSGIRTIVIGFGDSDIVLDAIAANGGMTWPYATPINATNLTKIQTLFSSQVVGCIYDINITDEMDLDHLNIYLVDDLGSDTVVPYDDDCSFLFGWRWVDKLTHDQIEFCPGICEIIKNGDVEEIIGQHCPTWVLTQI